MAPAKFIRTTISEKETLGEKLAKKRNSLHLDIKDIERALKIPARHVRMLEEGRYDKLPPDVFVRGFLKNYALYLGLKPKKVMDLYMRERGLGKKIREKEVNKKAPTVKPIKTPKFIITTKKFIIIFAAIVIVSIMVFIGWQVKILTAPPTLIINTPQEEITVTEDYIYVEGRTDREAELYINDVKIGTDDEGIFKERVSLQNGVNILKIRSQNKMQRETIVERKVLVNLPIDSSNVDRSIYPLELKLEIGPNPATVEIRVDGVNQSMTGTMLSGFTQVYYARKEIIVSTDNAGSTKISFNGKKLGKMGREGETIEDKKYIK